MIHLKDSFFKTNGFWYDKNRLQVHLDRKINDSIFLGLVITKIRCYFKLKNGIN